MPGPAGTCPHCHRPYALRADGLIRHHTADGTRTGTTCPGSRQKPATR
ncbi:hypothetical protein V2S66_03150 [Streptomyces sp. V4-01]|uniref:HNH endonuclease n=1 Tax=Actinacidiphila polyblastidii TaxID=3110430 RepID=A0ABU7P6L5_9ACTN|nr:hypothetical protein [Streptomyces sp. V4-01]